MLESLNWVATSHRAAVSSMALVHTNQTNVRSAINPNMACEQFQPVYYRSSYIHCFSRHGLYVLLMSVDDVKIPASVDSSDLDTDGILRSFAFCPFARAKHVICVLYASILPTESHSPYVWALQPRDGNLRSQSALVGGIDRGIMQVCLLQLAA